MRRLRASLLLIAVMLSGCSERTRAPPVASPAPAAFIGSATCGGCHTEQFRLWRGSHHELAMQPATRAAVLGDFRDARFEHLGVRTRFFRRGEEYWVATEGPTGATQEFRVEHTIGVDPLQQYLVALPGGRLQALTVAWDSRAASEGGQRWFDLQPEERVSPQDALHWTGPHYNWNSRCAECHTTGLLRNYDPGANTYATRFAEGDVGCESCHGPGSRHAQWAKTRAPGDRGLIPVDATWQRDACGSCHSRRQVLVEDAEVQSLPAYHDAFALALPTPPLYHADGQVRDEDFELGSFLQSRMHARGVLCSHCHEPHALQLRAPGNAVCARCHVAAVYDARSHHRHEPASPAAQCVSCHMPVTRYMVVDARHDHSLRVPRPDLTARHGTPNACGACHAERDATWAAERIAAWRGAQGRSLVAHFSERLASADSAEWLLLAADVAAPGIARAAALERLAQRPSREAVERGATALADADPLVRRAAVGVFAAVEPPTRVEFLASLATDPSRSVRLEAARLLSPADLAGLSETRRQELQRLFAEYVAALRARQDLPGNAVSLGIHHAERGETAAAEAAFGQALRVDPHFGAAALNLAELYRRQGREADARAALERALRLEPQAAALHHALGLQRVREGAYLEALDHLRRASELAPEDVEYGFVYAVALHDRGQRTEALALLQRLRNRFPGDVRLEQALRDFGATR